MPINSKKYKSYLDLVAKLNSYSEAYYNHNSSPISDEQYDALYRQLEYIERVNPNFVSKDSPTQRVGVVPDGVFAKVKHPIRMYSLSKIRTEKELRKFYKRFSELRHDLGRNVVDKYYLDYKMDGLSCDLVYTDGKLSLAITRGDGKVGEDVTQNALNIRNIPPYLNTHKNLIVHGEVVVHKSVFNNINRAREERGLVPFSNPRNYASGSLRQINPKVTRERGIMFYAWSLFVPGKKLTCEDQMEHLAKLGFNLPYGTLCSNVEEMLAMISDTIRKRPDLPYEIDGVVIKQNDPDVHKALGWNEHDPLWATAWKFAADGTETTIERISWNVGRTGKVTPLAHLDPININGVNIDTVTLYNAAKVEATKIGPGAKVKVIRSGDVIPKIENVIKSGTYQGIPDKCPICGQPLTRVSNDLFCTNPDCNGILASTLQYIVGKDVLDIKGIGESFIKEAINSGTITSLKDLLIPIDNKSSLLKQSDLDKLVLRARSMNLLELLMFIGVPSMGRSVAGKLAITLGSLKRLRETLADERKVNLLTVTKSVKDNLNAWYKSDRNKDLLAYIDSLDLEKLR